MFYWIAYFLLWLLSRIFFPITVYGSKHVPTSGHIIIASNHVSYLDPIILGLAYRRRISYLAKHTLFKNKLFGFVLKKVEAFPIKREIGDIGALREALKRLKNYTSLVVFPEGTRKGTVEDKEVRKGIGFLSAKSGVPVVPAYIVGSEHVLPVGAKRLKRHPIQVIFGEPLHFTSNTDYEQISLQIMRQVEALKPA